MNLDEARARLLRVSGPLAVAQQVQGETQTQLRNSLRQIIEAHADVPLNVSRGIQELVDGCVDDAVAGTRDPYIRLMARGITDTLESVSFLVGEGFYEAAWFRASDAVSLTGLYLDALTLEAQKPLVAQA